MVSVAAQGLTSASKSRQIRVLIVDLARNGDFQCGSMRLDCINLLTPFNARTAHYSVARHRAADENLPMARRHLGMGRPRR